MLIQNKRLKTTQCLFYHISLLTLMEIGYYCNTRLVSSSNSLIGNSSVKPIDSK